MSVAPPPVLVPQIKPTALPPVSRQKLPPIAPQLVTNGIVSVKPSAAESAAAAANKRRNGNHAKAIVLPTVPVPVSTTIPAQPPTIYPDAPSDRREFAVFWLQKNYQVHLQSSFPRVQVYADYQKAHQAHFGTSGALSAVDFHNTIK